MVFHAYVNEKHGSRRKIPSKNLVRQRCAEGFNYGVKGLMKHYFPRKIFEGTQMSSFMKIRPVEAVLFHADRHIVRQT
jgi:hypothetical protein